MTRRLAVRAYVTGTALVALVAVTATYLSAGERPFGRLWLLLAFAVLVCLDTVLSVRLSRGTESESRANEEALLVAMALLMPPLAVVCALASGILAGQLLLRRDPLKGFFNLAQFTAAAAIGLLVVAPLAPANGVSGRRTAAVVLAVLVFSLVNRLAVSGVLAVAGSGSFRRDFADDVGSAALLWAGNVAIGLLTGLAAAERGWAVALALPALAVLGVALSGHWRARREQQTLHDLVESSSAAIFSVDERGRVRIWNPEMREVTGRSGEESFGRPLGEVLCLRDPEGAPVDDLLAPITPARERRLACLETVSGGERWLVLSRAVLPDGGFVFAAQDITEQRQAQEALRESEERLRLALEAGRMGWWRLDLSSDEVHLSESQERQIGLPPGGFGGTLEEFVGRLHPDDRLLLEETIESVRTDGRGEVVYRTVWPDGTVRWLEGRALLLRDSGGRPVGMTGVAHDVTESREAEERLRAAEAKYRSLVEDLPLATYVDALDTTSSNIYTSPQIEKLLGYSREEWLANPDLFPKTLHPDDRERVLAEHARTYETGEPLRSEYRVTAKDGRVVWIQDEAVIVRDAGGDPLFMQGYMLDLTDRKQSERALRESEERFRQLFENARDMVCSLDESGRFTAINRAGEAITGYSSAEILGMSFEKLIAPEDVPRARGRFEWTMSGGVEAEIEEFEVVRKDGSRTTLEVSYSRSETLGGAQLELIARDVTERKRLEQELRQHAFYDSLTGLANRMLFWDRVTHALARRQGSAAVLFVDLDDFKNVNDSFGHPAGDRLLAEIADRLRACARPTDTCGRLGGDEFALLLEDVSAPGPAIQAAERILAALEAPIRLHGAEVSVGASIGIALQSSQTEETSEILRNADIAMYSVKARSKNGYGLFEPGMLETTQARLELTGELKRAIEEQQLSLHYQPIVELGSGIITGVEALVRWQHPERGLLSPGDFITLAEDTGLIVPLSRWVLAEACRQARRWQSAHPGDPPLGVGVNVSARHLQSEHLFSDVESALEESGLAPESLVLELTESVVADDGEAADKLSQLRGLGVRIALDDFGTGYSSLAYLQRLPADILKIDQSFVRALAEGAREQRLVSMILSLGESLGLSVIAEGIELAEERDQLYSLGCRKGQGFLFAHPLAPENLEPLLRTRVIEQGKRRLRLAGSGR